MSTANLANFPRASTVECLEAVVVRYHTLISVLLSFWAVCFSVMFGEKEFPGGPFVSFSGDILPLICAVAAFRIAFICYADDPPSKRALSWITAGLAASAATLIGLSMYVFFRSPFARGEFLGF